MKFLFILLFFASIHSDSIAQSITFAGKVINNDANLPIHKASVYIPGTKYGVYTNTDGEFKLILPGKGNYTIKFAFVGYKPLEISYDLNRDSTGNIILLDFASFDKESVTVFAESPGKRFMREVIKRKLVMQDSLLSYKYLLYTKFVATTDTLTAGRAERKEDSTIASILESYSKGYYKAKDKYFNEIIQKRQSINVPPQANFVAFGTNLNAYDDYVTILGNEISTPFHPDAPDYYEFEIIDEYKLEGKRVKRISVEPMSRFRKIFQGDVLIDEETLLPISVDLSPIESVNLPLGTRLGYSQNFIQFDEKFALPSRMTITATASADLLWIIAPRIDILIQTAAYDYEINVPLSNSLFQQRRVEEADGANVFDTLYWSDNDIIPLSKNEQEAYENIRMSLEIPDSLESTTFVDRALGPITTVMRRLARPPFTGFEDFIRYNRVHGLYTGIGLFDDSDRMARYEGKIGYGSMDRKFFFDLNAIRYLDKDRTWNIDFAIRNDLARIDRPYIVRNQSITFFSGLFGQDYGDYYYRQGAELGLEYSLGQFRFLRRNYFAKPKRFRMFARMENHSNAEVNSNFALFNWQTNFRDNPTTEEGRLHSLGFNIDWNYSQFRRLENFGFHIEAEFANKELLGGDFSFIQYYGELNYNFTTFPLMRMDLKLLGGRNFGNAPPQRFFSLESSVANTATRGAFRTLQVKEFYGDRFIAVNMEHNFGEIVPGLLRIDNIASFGVDFIGVVNLGWTEFWQGTRNRLAEKFKANYRTTTDNPDKIFYEAGLGLNKLFLFFRIDFTTRISKYESPRYIFTVSAAQFN